MVLERQTGLVAASQADGTRIPALPSVVPADAGLCFFPSLWPRVLFSLSLSDLAVSVGFSSLNTLVVVFDFSHPGVLVPLFSAL